MIARIVVLSVGLLFCLIGFVLIFEVKEGHPSTITGTRKRRLVALWALISLDFAFLAIQDLIRHGFAWKADLIPLFVGLIVSIAGLLVFKQVTDTAADDANAAMSKLTRGGLLFLSLMLSGCFIYVLVQLPNQQNADSSKVLATTLLVFVMGIAVVRLVYFFIRDEPDSLASDSDPMPLITRRVVASYLLLVGMLLLILLWHIGSIEFPDAGLKIETNLFGSSSTGGAASGANQLAVPLSPCLGTVPSVPSTPVASESAGAGGGAASSKRPILHQLFPQTTLAAVPLIYITAYGENFTTGSKIRFNQRAQPTVFVDTCRIQAPLDQSTIDSLDPISVDVSTNDQVSDAIAVSVTKSRAEDELLGWHFTLTRELQLLLLAMLAGALGSFIHALKSFGDFVGNRTLTTSWFWWYMTRPFLGAALAVVFYAVLRGGFMAGTPADAKAVNQFGVIAVGSLVGMFADKASDKLADIFDTLFKGTDNRSGKLAAPVIDQLDPATIPRGSAPMTLRIIGDRLGAVTQVKFDNVVHPHDSVGNQLVTVSLTAADLATQRTIKVAVVGDSGESPTKDLQIS